MSKDVGHKLKEFCNFNKYILCSIETQGRAQLMVGSRIRNQLIQMNQINSVDLLEKWPALTASSPQWSNPLTQPLASPWRTSPPTSPTDKLLFLADAPSVNAGGHLYLYFCLYFYLYLYPMWMQVGTSICISVCISIFICILCKCR